jgi:hypothetical protein
MDPIFYYYSKFVSIKQDEADRIVRLIQTLINDNSIFCELGSGWGNISVPIMYKLKEEAKSSIKWYGFERDQNKVNFSRKFVRYYNSDINNRINYDDYIEELRSNQSCRHFRQLINKINNTEPFEEDWFILKELDLEKTEEFRNDVFANFSRNKIDVLFIPFFFQHFKIWRIILQILFPYVNNKFVIISGELGGDWEVCFSPNKISTFNDWRLFFLKIWGNNTIIPTAMRDYKYYNLSVFSTFIENQGFKITDFLECPLELKVKTTEIELLHHVKHKVWSPFIQNCINYEQILGKKSFLKIEKEFLSIHNINVYSLEKK